MQLARVLGVATVIISATTTAIISCGGDSRPGGGGNIDAPAGSNHTDAAIDSPGSGSGSATGLGETCTPGTGSDTQGSCPIGFTCLNLQGGTNPWCSKTCVTGTGDMCKQGYTGPGLAQCILSVGSGSNMFCDVICEDDTSGHTICGSGSTCDDTCPGSLACTAVLTSNGSNVGKACD